MSIDRDRLADRLDPSAIREGLEERLDADVVRERVDERVDPTVVRTGLDGFYARYFLPPSVTEDELTTDEVADSERTEAVTTEQPGYEPFDFGAWLDAGSATGPEKPPAEPRVVTGAATAQAVVADADADADYGSFEFGAWLAAGEEFEPIEVMEPEPEPEPAEAAVDASPEPTPADGSSVRRPTFEIHPAKAATYALFLAVVALVGLTVAGLLPALGPTGLAG